MSDLTRLLTVNVKVKNKNDEKVKEASVKQSFLLACVKDVPESWANCKTILEKTKTNSLTAKWVLDFKLGNIISGLQNHNSKHCCEYCKAFKNEFGEWVIGSSEFIQLRVTLIMSVLLCPFVTYIH